MRVYLHCDGNPTDYVYQLIRHLCQSYGVPMVEHPSDADAVLVSCCDITEIGSITKARQYGRPVIAGGFISILPVVRALADIVCVGEGYTFIRAMAQATDPFELLQLPNAASYEKPATQVDEWIDWPRNPVAQVSKTSFYYYCGKGCPLKCKFCLMSYTRHLQDAPVGYVRKALRAIPPKAKLYLMVSYMRYKLTPAEMARLGSTDVMVREYLRGGQDSLRRVRCGIEFWGEDLRRDLAKPISTEQLQQFVALTGADQTEVTAYIIAGLEPMEAVREFAEAMPGGHELKPRFIIAPTLFDPQLYTPLADFDIRQRQSFDHDRAMRILGARNRRFRLHRPLNPAKASWRNVMQRATTRAEAGFCWGLRNWRDNDALLRAVESEHPSLLGTKTLDEIRHNRRRFDPALWGNDREVMRGHQGTAASTGG
jgi:hypothetical protein